MKRLLQSIGDELHSVVKENKYESTRKKYKECKDGEETKEIDVLASSLLPEIPPRPRRKISKKVRKQRKKNSSQSLFSLLFSKLEKKSITVDALFSHMDIDDSDSITYDEFRAGLANVGISFSMDTLRRTFSALDRDNDNSISRNEMQSLYLKESENQRLARRARARLRKEAFQEKRKLALAKARRDLRILEVEKIKNNRIKRRSKLTKLREERKGEKLGKENSKTVRKKNNNLWDIPKTCKNSTHLKHLAKQMLEKKISVQKLFQNFSVDRHNRISSISFLKGMNLEFNSLNFSQHQLQQVYKALGGVGNAKEGADEAHLSGATSFEMKLKLSSFIDELQSNKHKKERKRQQARLKNPVNALLDDLNDLKHSVAYLFSYIESDRTDMITVKSCRKGFSIVGLSGWTNAEIKSLFKHSRQMIQNRVSNGICFSSDRKNDRISWSELKKLLESKGKNKKIGLYANVKSKVRENFRIKKGKKNKEMRVKKSFKSKISPVKRLIQRLRTLNITVGQLFACMDVDRSNNASVAEFKRGLEMVGIYFDRPEVVRTIFNAFDLDGDGLVSWIELRKMLSGYNEADEIKKIQKREALRRRRMKRPILYLLKSLQNKGLSTRHLYHCMKTDRDDKIDSDGFYHGLQRCGIVRTNDEVRDIFAEFNEGLDGRVAWVEILHRLEVVRRSLHELDLGEEQELRKTLNDIVEEEEELGEGGFDTSDFETIYETETESELEDGEEEEEEGEREDDDIVQVEEDNVIISEPKKPWWMDRRVDPNSANYKHPYERRRLARKKAEKKRIEAEKLAWEREVAKGLSLGESWLVERYIEEEKIEFEEFETRRKEEENHFEKQLKKDLVKKGELTKDGQETTDKKILALTKYWFFKDKTDSAQGPYTSQQMRDWLSGGFITGNTLIQEANGAHDDDDDELSELPETRFDITHFSEKYESKWVSVNDYFPQRHLAFVDNPRMRPKWVTEFTLYDFDSNHEWSQPLQDPQSYSKLLESELGSNLCKRDDEERERKRLREEELRRFQETKKIEEDLSSVKKQKCIEEFQKAAQCDERTAIWWLEQTGGYNQLAGKALRAYYESGEEGPPRYFMQDEDLDKFDYEIKDIDPNLKENLDDDDKSCSADEGEIELESDGNQDIDNELEINEWMSPAEIEALHLLQEVHHSDFGIQQRERKREFDEKLSQVDTRRKQALSAEKYSLAGVLAQRMRDMQNKFQHTQNKMNWRFEKKKRQSEAGKRPSEDVEENKWKKKRPTPLSVLEARVVGPDTPLTPPAWMTPLVLTPSPKKNKRTVQALASTTPGKRVNPSSKCLSPGRIALARRTLAISFAKKQKRDEDKRKASKLPLIKVEEILKETSDLFHDGNATSLLVSSSSSSPSSKRSKDGILRLLRQNSQSSINISNSPGSPKMFKVEETAESLFELRNSRWKGVERVPLVDHKRKKKKRNEEKMEKTENVEEKEEEEEEGENDKSEFDSETDVNYVDAFLHPSIETEEEKKKNPIQRKVIKNHGNLYKAILKDPNSVGKVINLGYYSTPKEAALAHDKSVKQLYSQNAWKEHLNFDVEEKVVEDGQNGKRHNFDDDWLWSDAVPEEKEENSVESKIRSLPLALRKYYSSLRIKDLKNLFTKAKRSMEGCRNKEEMIRRILEIEVKEDVRLGEFKDDK
eukprot:g2279.t1